METFTEDKFFINTV